MFNRYINYQWAIFNSYVSLPEGKQNLKHHLNISENHWKMIFEHLEFLAKGSGIHCRSKASSHTLLQLRCLWSWRGIPAAIEQVQAHSFTPTHIHM